MKKTHKDKITAIVPAYNEEKNILHVLKVLKQSPYIDEVICVNDGSTDNTLKIVKKIDGIGIITSKVNRGKGYAMAKGVQKAVGNYIFFIDADLHGLNSNHIKKLALTLISSRYDAVIGYPTYYKTDELFKPLSGQRGYAKKDLLPFLGSIAKKGYGIELYLNFIFKNKRVKLIPLDGAKNILKHKKQSYDVATKLFIIESFDILFEAIKQNNPLPQVIQSYLYPFNLKKPKKVSTQIDSFFYHIKKLLETL